MLHRYGERLHKVLSDVGTTCHVVFTAPPSSYPYTHFVRSGNTWNATTQNHDDVSYTLTVYDTTNVGANKRFWENIKAIQDEFGNLIDVALEEDAHDAERDANAMVHIVSGTVVLT